MNKKYRDETIETKFKESKNNLFNKYKDLFEIKYKRLHAINIQSQKETSKTLLKTFYIDNKKKKDRILNYINIPNKSAVNSSIEFNNNKLNISTPNFIKSNLKNNNYLIPLNRNKNIELFHSPSVPYAPFKIGENNISGNYENTKYENHLQKISNIFNNKSSCEKSNILFPNKLCNKKILNIRQKFLFRKNNSQQNIFNIDKNIFDLSKTTKNEKSFNNSYFYNSMYVNKRTPKSKEEMNLKSKLIKVREIDLKLEELLKKTKKGEEEKNNELKEKNEKIKKQKFLQNLAKFYDNLPSLILKKNINKYDLKPCKNKSQDFTQNFRTTIKIVKKEENNLDKLFRKNPIIKYLFLQKILNSLVRKIKILENHENIDINSNMFINVNEEIEDFITYGYEFIPENLLINKYLESPKNLLTNKQFIDTLLKTQSNIDNIISKSPKVFSNIELNMLLNNEIKISSKNINENEHQNLMKRFLEAHDDKDRLQRKSRFLYKKRIDIDKKDIKQLENNKEIKDENNKMNYNKKNDNIKNYSLAKDSFVVIKSNRNRKNKKNNNVTILSQIFNVLFNDINNLDDKIKKDKIKYGIKEDTNQNKEKYWQRILSKNNEGELCVIKKKNKTSTNSSGKKSRNKKKNNFFRKYRFTSIKNRVIKSCNNYQEINLDENNYVYETVNLSRKNIISKKYNVSSDNNKNELNKGKNNNEKEKTKNKNDLTKKEENKDTTKENPIANDLKKLEIIPESKDLLETIKENNVSNVSNIGTNKKEQKEIIDKKEEVNDIIKEKKIIKKEKDINNKKHHRQHLSSKKKEKYELEREEEIKIEKEYELELEKEYELEERKIKKRIKKKNKTNNLKNNSLQEYLLKQTQQAEENSNNNLLINLLNQEEKKSKRTKKNKKNIKINQKKEIEIEKEIKKEKKLIILYFNDVEDKPLEDIERKKIELLYKFKHDIEYKISIGGIKSIELEKFEEFKKKIINLKHGSGDEEIKNYIKNLETLFQSFRDEIENDQKKKIEEDRINKYLYQFLQNYNTKIFYKDIQTNKLCKVINFSEINHINTLIDTSL